MGVDHELVAAVAEYITLSQKVIARLMDTHTAPTSERKFSEDEPRDAHGEWTTGDGGESAATKLSPQVAKILKTIAEGDVDKRDRLGRNPKAIAAIVAALKTQPPAPELWRGIGIVPAEDGVPETGAIVPWTLSSCSSDQDAAKDFMESELGALTQYDDSAVGVIFQVAPGGQAIDLAGISDYKAEKEWVTNGRFQIDEVRVEAGVIRVKVHQVSVESKTASLGEVKYSDSEPRDDHGRWDSGGGGGTVPDREGHPIRAGMDIYDAETGERGHVVAVRRDDELGHHLALVHLPHFTNPSAPTGHHIVLSRSLASTEHGVYPRQDFAALARAQQAAQDEYGPHGAAFKGDTEGHEFHGNRFTGGIGGGLRPEVAARAAHVMDQIIKAEAEGKCTNMPPNEHDPNAPGRYSAARQAQHDAIINAILDENKAVPAEHKAWIMGGLGGAGKTTLLSAGAPGTANEDRPITMPDGTTRTAAEVFGVQAVPGGPGRGGGSTPVLSNAVNVNADDITERMAAAGMLPEVDHLAPMEMSYLAHEEASTMSHELADRVIARGQNMIWDVTLGSKTSGLDRIAQLRAAGYNVTGVFVDVSVDHSIAAALSRYQAGVDRYAKGVGLGGRYVPPSLIEQGRDGDEAYSKNRLAFDSLVADGAFDKSVVIDNEKGERRVVKMA